LIDSIDQLGGKLLLTLSLVDSLQEQFTGHKAGHSGYLKILGRVIRVVKNSGIENCYPIFALKKHYPIIRVRVRVLPDIPEIDKTNHSGRIQVLF
jgi:hypothetical protein